MRLEGDEPGGAIPRLRVRAMAQLKCIYTNTCSIGNKQEDLEAIVQQENGYSCHHRNMVG